MARYASSSNTNKLANPFFGKTKAEMKKIYDEKIRKAGKSGEELRKIASQMQSALKSAPKGKPKAQPAASKPKTTPKADPQRNTGSGRDGSFGLGTSGKGRPSGKGKPTDKPAGYDPKGPTVYRKKTEPKKTEVKGSRKRFQKPTRKGLGIKEAVSKAVKALDKGLKLTYKKGDKKKVGGITYVHNGKRFVRYTV